VSLDEVVLVWLLLLLLVDEANGSFVVVFVFVVGDGVTTGGVTTGIVGGGAGTSTTGGCVLDLGQNTTSTKISSRTNAPPPMPTQAMTGKPPPELPGLGCGTG